MEAQQIHQPLHPDVRPFLDMEYAAFHDKYMQYVEPDDKKIWDGNARSKPSLPYGGSEALPMYAIDDVKLDKCQIRVFVPHREISNHGESWPALLWFHGGGWAIGGLDSENDFCTFIAHGNTGWAFDKYIRMLTSIKHLGA
jgi:acetyl esterase/lipase